MKAFPLPVLLASTGAITTLPFSIPASAMLALTAGLGAILSADYAHRYRGLAVPRLQPRRADTGTPRSFATELNRLAA